MERSAISIQQSAQVYEQYAVGRKDRRQSREAWQIAPLAPDLVGGHEPQLHMKNPVNRREEEGIVAHGVDGEADQDECR